MKKVLVIEDNKEVGALIEEALRTGNYDVRLVPTGGEGLEVFRNAPPDLLILDLTLPDVDGTEICRTIRKTDDTTPIFILSARTEEIDRVLGLELGADDYISKPFSLRELKARLDTFFRRWDKNGRGHDEDQSAESDEDTVIDRGELRIDLKRRVVLFRDKLVHISRKEFDILRLLAKTPGKIFSREMILDAVWGSEWDGFERIIDSHIKRIRAKLENQTGRSEWIETVWGSGYRFTLGYDELNTVA